MYFVLQLHDQALRALLADPGDSGKKSLFRAHDALHEGGYAKRGKYRYRDLGAYSADPGKLGEKFTFCHAGEAIDAHIILRYAKISE
jgi:hypothetical protein